MHKDPKLLEDILSLLALTVIGLGFIAFLSTALIILFSFNLNVPIIEDILQLADVLKDFLFTAVIMLFILFAVAKMSDGHFSFK